MLTTLPRERSPPTAAHRRRRPSRGRCGRTDDRGVEPAGRYGPLVCVTRFDTAPPELEWQLPLNGELTGSCRAPTARTTRCSSSSARCTSTPATGFDLRRVEPEQQVQDRKGRTMVRVHALLLCARFVGQQLHPGMTDLAVNLAYVIDNSLARDAEVDFAKIEFAAIGFLSEGHAPARHGAPAREPSQHDDAPRADVGDGAATHAAYGLGRARRAAPDAAPRHRGAAGCARPPDDRSPDRRCATTA